MTIPPSFGSGQQTLASRTVRDVVEYSPGQVDEVWCRKILRQILQSLELQYAMHMPHRPVTPDTIVFHEGGEPMLVPSDLIVPGRKPATPEDALRDDLTALAGIIHYAITGELLPEGPLGGRGYDNYSDSLVAAVDRCMAPDPATRPRTIAEVRDLLGIVVPGSATPAHAGRRPAEGPAIVVQDKEAAAPARQDDPVAAPHVRDAVAPAAPDVRPVAEAPPTDRAAVPADEAVPADVPLAQPAPHDIAAAADIPAPPIAAAMPAPSRTPAATTELASPARSGFAETPGTTAAPGLAQPGAASAAPPAGGAAQPSPSARPSAQPQPPQIPIPTTLSQPHAAKAPLPAVQPAGQARLRTGLNRGQRWALAAGAAAVLAGIALFWYAEMRDAATYDRMALTLPQRADAPAGAAGEPATPAPVPEQPQAGAPQPLPTPPAAPAALPAAPAAPSQATVEAADAAQGADAMAPVDSAQPSTAEPAAPGASASSARPAAPGAARPTATAGKASYRLQIQPWGVVYVDGVDRGVSPPVKRLELAPGRHTVRVANPNFQDRVLEVDTARGDGRIAVDFTRETP